jgi:hypothetical protein
MYYGFNRILFHLVVKSIYRDTEVYTSGGDYMFKKTVLIIASTVLIAQLAGFYEKNFIGKNDDGVKNTSPRLYNNAKIVKQDNHMFIPLYTLINMKSSNLIANL